MEKMLQKLEHEFSEKEMTQKSMDIFLNCMKSIKDTRNMTNTEYVEAYLGTDYFKDTLVVPSSQKLHDLNVHNHVHVTIDDKNPKSQRV